MKDSQLQIRISGQQKESIKRAAAAAGMDISSWVLDRCLNQNRTKFHEIIKRLERSLTPTFELAELNYFLDNLPAREFHSQLQSLPTVKLDAELANRIAAMIEYAAEKKQAIAPEWTVKIKPLAAPVFDTDLKSLKTYLLLNSPTAFKRRNIFLDSSIGDQV
ncbi:MAG: DUF1778 domain-containing protein [Bdellovibrionales bacterium]|nr:DUF1778 domain-containing protein [Bdellovibrionales bacterium]